MATHTVNIPTQLKVQDATTWASDATVYGEKTMLIVSDEFWSGTDQRKFKISDGVQTFANLDFVPFTPDAITADSTDTLTNKTIDANGTGNSISNIDVEDLADGTDGELITWDASGVADTVAAGTSGQVLTSNGAGAAPTFQAAAGGDDTKYVQYINTNNTALNDTTTYTIGASNTVMGLNANQSVQVELPTCTVTSAYITTYNGSVVGSSENVTINLVHDDAVTTTLISSTITCDGNRSKGFTVTGLSISVTNGLSYIEIVTPTFATNPNAARIFVQLEIEE